MQASEAGLGARVSLEGIRKAYGRLEAVRGVDLDIRKGEFISLLGPSGSGKSTLLMMIAGFEQPTAGRLSIGGRDVTRVPPDKRDIGMVFQNYALFPHLTVGENVGFALKQRSVGRAERQDRVRKALDLVQLPGLEGRFPQQLSGGQQQRVAIARAVIFDPTVLLMDEPLSALDKQLREGMQLEIKHLHARLGITFIYVTHDQREALVMSDRVAVLNHGVVEQIGRPTELYDEPRNQFVASFIGEANFLAVEDGGAADGATRLVKLGGTALRARTGPEGRFTPVCMVRPEKVQLLAPGDEGAGAEHNRVAGTVRETTFMGDAVRYLVEAAGQALVVKQPHRADLRLFSAGEAATVRWAVDDARLV